MARREHYKKYYLKNKKRITAQIKIYHATSAGKKATQISSIRQRQKYPEKYQARQEVLKAIRKGSLIKQPCEICGIKKVEAHHDDYSKPLKVKWLCNKHHRDIENN